MIPQPIQSVPMAAGRDETPIKALIYCPDEGGWHVGVWLRAGHRDETWMRQGWRSTIDHTIELRPTHWLPYPEEPMTARVDRPQVVPHITPRDRS